MSEALTFPPGVLTGTPFARAADAVAWLNRAFEGEYGHEVGSFPYMEPALMARPLPMPWPLRVATTNVWPTRIVEVGFTDQGTGDHSTALEWADGPADAAGINSRTITAVRWNANVPGDVRTFPSLPGEVIGFLPAVGAPTSWYPVPLRWAVLMLVTSWHNACRRVFDAASKRDRPVLAKPLGNLETAVADAEADFVNAANAWVSTVWADACTEGIECDPDDPHSPVLTPPAPAGMFTLHTA